MFNPSFRAYIDGKFIKFCLKELCVYSRDLQPAKDYISCGGEVDMCAQVPDGEGTFVYENDILWDNVMEEAYKVVWDEGGFALEDTVLGNAVPIDIGELAQMVVAGNTHEEKGT